MIIERPEALLKEVFGFEEFRPGQEEIVTSLLARKDVLVIMPTGGGKSLCYQLPALCSDGLTVVVSPLIALIDNQLAQLRGVGASADAIHSGQSRDANVAAWRRAANGQTRLLYMSPERLMSPRMLAALQRLKLARFVVDEAHCVSQWGHDFRPEYLAVDQLKDLFPDTPIAAFTATADDRTRTEIEARLLRNEALKFVHSLDRPNIEISIEDKYQAKNRILDLLTEFRGAQGIIYCLSRKQTEDIATHLTDNGHNACAYHAGLEPALRNERLNAFLTEPDLIIVATVAFGMGIDKPDIRFVIHHDMPASIEAYYQEMGRAGRDGLPARAVLFYAANDLSRRLRLINDNSNEKARIAEKRRLEELSALCESAVCRHQALLAHFGQNTSACGSCDVCRTPPQTEDASDCARLAIAVVVETGSLYGMAHIADILRGADTERIRTLGHDTSRYFGAGKHRSAAGWRDVLRQMAREAFLRIEPQYGGISSGPRAPGLLRGENSFNIRVRGEKKKTRRHSSRGAQAPIKTVNRDLLAALKAKRLELAIERNAPAFVIFSDRTLADMANRKPASLEEFSQLFGVGRAKTAAFGEVFIRVIAEYAENERSVA